MESRLVKVPLARMKLEALCALYLRHHPRCATVSRVSIRRPFHGCGNWEIENIEPRQSIVADHVARQLILELHDNFRMAE